MCVGGGGRGRDVGRSTRSTLWHFCAACGCAAVQTNPSAAIATPPFNAQHTKHNPPEPAVRNCRRHVRKLQSKAAVRLVAAVARHRVGVGEAREGPRQLDALDLAVCVSNGGVWWGWRWGLMTFFRCLVPMLRRLEAPLRCRFVLRRARSRAAVAGERQKEQPHPRPLPIPSKHAPLPPPHQCPPISPEDRRDQLLAQGHDRVAVHPRDLDVELRELGLSGWKQVGLDTRLA